MCIAEQMHNLFKEISLNSILTYQCLDNAGKDLRDRKLLFSSYSPWNMEKIW